MRAIAKSEKALPATRGGRQTAKPRPSGSKNQNDKSSAPPLTADDVMTIIQSPRKVSPDVRQPSNDAVLSVHCIRCQTPLRAEMDKLHSVIECPYCNGKISLPSPERFFDFHTKIKGVTHRNKNGTDRQSIIRTCRKGEILFLSREPDNAHDANAVAVLTRNEERLGYLSADLAGTYSPILRLGKPTITTIADITGDEIMGVNIHIMVIGYSR